MLPRGSMIDILAKTQADFATAATGDYTRSFVYQEKLAEKQSLENDPLLGQPRHNSRDALAPILGLPTHGGQIEVPVCLAHLGFWLVSVFGLPTTTGADPNFVHAFESGAEAIPYRTVEVKVPIVGGTKFLRHAGVIADKLTLDVSRAAGYQRATLDLLGYQETKLSVSGGGAPADPWALDRVLNSQGVVKIDGVAAELLACNATYDNKLKGLEYAGSDRVGGYDSDEDATFTGTMRVRFKDFSHYDRAVAGTAASLEFLWQKTANRLLSIVAGVTRLERQGVEISGPGGIEQTFNFMAEQTAAAPMLAVTLKNGVSTYA